MKPTHRPGGVRSRKLWLTIFGVLMLYAGPMAYKFQGISDQVTMLAMGAIGTLVGSYLGVNVLQKRFENSENEPRGEE